MSVSAGKDDLALRGRAPAGRHREMIRRGDRYEGAIKAGTHDPRRGEMNSVRRITGRRLGERRQGRDDPPFADAVPV